jgi:hypothetical protein
MRDAVAFLVGAAIAAALTLGIVRWTDGMAVDWQLTFESVAYLSALGAVLIAAWWVWLTANRRQATAPQTALVHRHQVWADSTGTLLRVSIEIHNPTEGVLVPGDGMTFVQLPPLDAIDPCEYSYTRWRDIAAIRHASAFERIRIAPRETHGFVHDVRLPEGARFVQIHSWLMRHATRKLPPDPDGDGRPVGAIDSPGAPRVWSATTLVDLGVQRSRSSLPELKPFNDHVKAIPDNVRTLNDAARGSAEPATIVISEVI